MAEAVAAAGAAMTNLAGDLLTYFGGEASGTAPPRVGDRGESLSWARQQKAACKVFNEFVAHYPNGVGPKKTTKPFEEQSEEDFADVTVWEEFAHYITHVRKIPDGVKNAGCQRGQSAAGARPAEDDSFDAQVPAVHEARRKATRASRRVSPPRR